MKRLSPALAVALLAGLGACKRSAPNAVRLTDADLPYQKLYALQKGGVIRFELPNGRRVVYGVEDDEFGAGEQTTSCGLKTRCWEPAFDQLKNSCVSTSTRQSISIYSYDLDGYHVEVAEDLKATHNLPVVVRVSTAAAAPLTHEQLRALFDNKPPKEEGPPLRVPISTVHHELNQKFDFPVRLLVMNGEFTFDVGGDVHALKEEEQVAKLTPLMECVVQRYQDIDQISRFAIDVMKNDSAVATYVARRSADGHWELQKQKP